MSILVYQAPLDASRPPLWSVVVLIVLAIGITYSCFWPIEVSWSGRRGHAIGLYMGCLQYEQVRERTSAKFAAPPGNVKKAPERVLDLPPQPLAWRRPQGLRPDAAVPIRYDVLTRVGLGWTEYHRYHLSLLYPVIAIGTWTLIRHRRMANRMA